MCLMLDKRGGLNGFYSCCGKLVSAWRIEEVHLDITCSSVKQPGFGHSIGESTVSCSSNKVIMAIGILLLVTIIFTEYQG